MELELGYMNESLKESQVAEQNANAIPWMKPTELADLVRQIRDERGWSFRGMWKATGVHYTTLAQIERGEIRPTAKVVQKLANALNLQGPEREQFVAAGLQATRRLLSAAKVGQLELIQKYLAGLDRAAVGVEQVATATVTSLKKLPPDQREQLVKAWKQGLEAKLKLLNALEPSSNLTGMVITTKAGKLLLVDVVVAVVEGK